MESPPAAPTDPLPVQRVSSALRFSRFCTRLLQAHPDWDEERVFAPFRGWDQASMQRFLAASPASDAQTLDRRLRELRNRVVLRLALRDLSGIAPLDEVHATMSGLAELSVRAAHQFWTRTMQAEHGVPRSGGVGQELLVVAMGKLGGAELNVSSDIDLVFIFPGEGETDGARPIPNLEFFIRLGQRIIGSLERPSAEGFAFRVDMRLRPWGSSGPLASSLDSLENYLLVHGREWERYAWMKARVIAGRACTAEGTDAGAALESAISRFVYRRYLDYDAIGALRELHRQIRTEVQRRDLAGHIKLGPGGIREIEFITQAHQMVRGGRDPQLQMQPTMPALELLAEKQLIARPVACELLEAYTFLRHLEHRLQYLDDAQTHTLPASAQDLGLVAQAMGFDASETFLAALQGHRDRVSGHFSAVFAARSDEEDADADADRGLLEALWQGTIEQDRSLQCLVALGYDDAAEALRQIQALRASSHYRGIPAGSQTRIDALVPAIVRVCARQGRPQATLARLLQFVEAISGRSVYLGYLSEHPAALERLAGLVGSSGWAARYLTGHPILIDELLAPQQDGPVEAQAWAETLRQSVAPFADDMERAMDIMREEHHAQVFRLLVRDLDGAIGLEALSDELSALADGVLQVTQEQCWRRLRGVHREAPAFAIIGYGKLGGKELGYASDLDLLFVYDDEDPRAGEIYARLAQRIIGWLSSRTAAGQLFETDLRLRPDGAAGLLVSSLSAFRRYQREAAWTWEHQALTRARFCAGDPALGSAFEAVRNLVLCLPREQAELRTEINAMRERMFQAHPNPSGLFDIKHGRGGMVDIEFSVQYLVLGHAHRLPQLTANSGNIALLRLAGELGLVEPQLAAQAAQAYREFRRLQHRLRLDEAEYARVPFESVAAWAGAARRLWDILLGPRPDRPEQPPVPLQ